MNINLNWFSTLFQMSNSLIIPSHLKETIRYRQYQFNKRGDLQALAQELAEGPKEKYAFLGYPLEPKTIPMSQMEKADSDVFV